MPVGGAPFVEDSWVGRDVQIGDAVVHIKGRALDALSPLSIQTPGHAMSMRYAP